MANIARWLTEMECSIGETIESVVIGRHYDDRYEETERTGGRINEVLSRDDALRILDMDFDCGFGGANCFPMYAWTASRVCFISEYDGATVLSYVPRHPVACEPCFDGGDSL